MGVCASSWELSAYPGVRQAGTTFYHSHPILPSERAEIGFDYVTPIYWHKITNIATEVGGGRFLGKPYEPGAVLKNDIECILMLRKTGGYRKPTPVQRALSLIDVDDHRRWFRSIWSDIQGESRKRGHPAPYPIKLAERLIQMFSFVGDTVLDPFWGTGTTTAAAMQTTRSSIGYEIEPKYIRRGRRPDQPGRRPRCPGSGPLLPVNGPAEFVHHLATHGYHPRSDAHSNAICRAILGDIIEHCPIFAERAKAGKIVARINHRVRVGHEDWTIDLAIGRSPDLPMPPTVEAIRMGTPAIVEIALEAKAIMTEHGKARRNRQRDLQAFHGYAHRYNPKHDFGGDGGHKRLGSFLVAASTRGSYHVPPQHRKAGRRYGQHLPQPPNAPFGHRRSRVRSAFSARRQAG